MLFLAYHIDGKADYFVVFDLIMHVFVFDYTFTVILIMKSIWRYMSKTDSHPVTVVSDNEINFVDRAAIAAMQSLIERYQYRYAETIAREAYALARALYAEKMK